jgi:hypothetical protein
MKLLSTIKTTLANVTDHLAAAAQHVPPIAHVTVSNPATGSAVTLTPAQPFTLTKPAPGPCPHCGK